MSDVFEILKTTNYPMDFQPGATVQDLAAFENQNAIRIPKEYKNWLMFSNGGEILVPGSQFYSIDNSDDDSLIFHNSDDYRHKFSLPSSLYIVGRTNFGDLLCLDIMSGEFVQWDHETDEEFLRWKSMYEYVNDELQSYSEEN